MPPGPYLSLGSLPVLLFPILLCAAGWNLLGRCLCGSFCCGLHLCLLPSARLSSSFVSRACVHLFRLPGLPFASRGCVHLFQLLRLASVSQVWCGLVSALWGCPLRRRVYALVSSHCLHSLSQGVICSSFSCAMRVACAAQVCMPPLYRHRSPALCSSCVCLRLQWAT